jgi:hypothetical protein
MEVETKKNNREERELGRKGFFGLQNQPPRLLASP